MEKNNQLIKLDVILIGNEKSGKTSLLLRYIDGIYNENKALRIKGVSL